ncbi:MAG: hypothetical protein CM15mV2_3540 [uncultured marine virus]|nr:MAG: hypothetical protein CM15mV2_3540 [uncultured marine virus]
MSICRYGESIKDRHITKWLSYWYIDNLWVNYMQQHDCNPLHDHTGTISFIIYLNDVPEAKTEAKTESD